MTFHSNKIRVEDTDNPLLQFKGTETGDQTSNLSTQQGSGALQVPLGATLSNPGWYHHGLIKVEIKDASNNIVEAWWPEYTYHATHCGYNCSASDVCECNRDDPLHCIYDCTGNQCYCNINCDVCDWNCPCEAESHCFSDICEENCICDSNECSNCICDPDNCVCDPDCADCVDACQTCWEDSGHCGTNICGLDCSVCDLDGYCGPDICYEFCTCDQDAWCICNVDPCCDSDVCSDGECTCNSYYICGDCGNGDELCSCDYDCSGCFSNCICDSDSGCGINMCESSGDQTGCGNDCSACYWDCTPCYQNCVCFWDLCPGGDTGHCRSDCTCHYDCVTCYGDWPQ